MSHLDSDAPHTCHFCGTYVKDGYEDAAKTKRHWLSDCRPDLVEHEIGDLCTWSYRRQYFTKPDRQGITYKESECCYAYQSNDDMTWTDEHKHFYKDGPM